MKISFIAFTEKGCKLAKSIASDLNGDICTVYMSGRMVQTEGITDSGNLRKWTEDRFADSEALVFVSAVGIAVRAIAPNVKDKFTDPAVVVIDENGQFVISLLSGHVGGANILAKKIAGLISATPVVTTATDINGRFSVDSWAKDNRLYICDREIAKEVSVSLLDGKSVGFVSDFPVSGELPEGLVNGTDPEIGISISLDEVKKPFSKTVRLIPRILTVGIGCRKGTGWSDIKTATDNALAENRLSINAVRALASIDVKENETGLLEYAGQTELPITFYSKGELSALWGDFTASDFVKGTVGVDNVCERSAAMSGGKLIIKKRAAGGVTVAAAADNLILRFS